VINIDLSTSRIGLSEGHYPGGSKNGTRNASEKRGEVVSRDNWGVLHPAEKADLTEAGQEDREGL